MKDRDQGFRFTSASWCTVLMGLSAGVLLLTLASCDGPKADNSDKPIVVKPGDNPEQTFKKSDFKDWPLPKAVFAFTGEMHGYIEPCGCSEPQFGGIARRASLFNQLRDKKWPLAAIDLGGTLKNSRQQSQFKFQALLAALRDMKYSSLQIGIEELQLGAGWLLSQDTPPEEGQPADGLRLLGANVLLFGSKELPTPLRHQLLKVGDLKIGVTGVFGSAFKSELNAVDESEVSITDPHTAIDDALKALKEQKPDLLVLVSHSSPNESRKLAEKYTDFKLVLSTGGEEPLSDNPLMVGDTLMVMPGHKGKYVALVGYYPEEPQQKFRFDLVRLDGERFKNDAKMLEHMRFYQDMLKDAKLAETEPALKHSSGDSFVGAEKCGECHTKALSKWKESKHSHAFESLKTGRLGISRIYDPECICCHTVGWNPEFVSRYETGYLNDNKTSHLKGVQCENCHGPGSKHIALIEAGQKEEANKLVRVTLEQASNNKRQGCMSCHDSDNSPKFDFKDYWPQIAHPGKD